MCDISFDFISSSQTFSRDACINIFIYIYTCVYIYIYIYIYNSKYGSEYDNMKKVEKLNNPN